MGAGGGSTPVYVGSYVGTGAILNIDVVGFKPRRIEFINEDQDGARSVWQDSMPDDSLQHTDSGTDAFATSDGVTPRDTGFAVGTNGDINTDGEVVHFTAWP